MVSTWSTQEEYSHGFLLPLVAAFLIWEKRGRLEQIDLNGSWLGILIVIFGGFLYLAGRMATISTMGQYAFLVTLAGLILSFAGWRGFREILLPLTILLFMVKLPTFIYHNLSSQLQLISSQIGVWFIRLFDISVYLEGNVIDLATMRLQVVEACSGLRYLFPLMALGVILAILYKAPAWKRWFIFLSTIPITIIMNSFRIGVIGVTAEYWGQEMAEGFLHDFEGWAVFMSAFGVLLIEILLLIRLTGDRRPFREILAIDIPAPRDPGAEIRNRTVPKPFYLAIGVIASIFIVASNIGDRSFVYPDREFLDAFPTHIGERKIKQEQMEQMYVDILHFDDYLLADFQQPGRVPINLYIAYYDVQAQGEGTVHSPRSCLPGGGWRIKEITQETVDGVEISGKPLRVNRVLITQGDQKTLVYYWLQQRSRIITNEFMAKWWIFWDGLTRSRTDGSLVRLTIDLRSFAHTEDAEKELTEFAGLIAPELPRFIPD